VATLTTVSPPATGVAKGDGEELLVSDLWDLLRHYQFHREPVFAGLHPADPDADSLLHASRHGRELDPADQLWLNRHLLETAFRQAMGHPCFHRLNSGLDGVLVSDVGKPFEVKIHQRAGGLLQTAMRSTDICMDRVWQLEIETFHDAPGFVFAPVTDVVEPVEDPTAPHPEIQRQAAHIRTDMDRFSMLEISTLVRHGYCVGRKACRARPDLFGTNLPTNAPWDPVPSQRGPEPAGPVLNCSSLLPRPLLGKGAKGAPVPVTVEARSLQHSALRRVWSTLLDWRDWVSYIYVPIIIPILVLMPYFVVKSYQRSHRLSQLVESLSQGSRDLEVMTRLLEEPVPPFSGVKAEEVRDLGKFDFAGFEVLQDSRILDLRNWNPTAAGKRDTTSLVYGYRRLKVVKREENPGNNLFRIDVLASHPNTQVRFPQQELPATLRMSPIETKNPEEKRTRFQATWDFEDLPPGEYVDLIYEHSSPAVFLQRGERSTSIAIHMQADTAEVTRWFLMPQGKEYKNFRITRYQEGKPGTVEAVKVVTEYLADDSTILAYKLMSCKGGYTYEVTWYYK
jgi:hypothetical protein